MFGPFEVMRCQHLLSTRHQTCVLFTLQAVHICKAIVGARREVSNKVGVPHYPSPAEPLAPQRVLKRDKLLCIDNIMMY